MTEQYYLMNKHGYTTEDMRIGQEFDLSQEKLEQAWLDLQAVPSYIEQQARAWAAELAMPIEEV